MMLYNGVLLCYYVQYECVVRHIGNGTLCERCKASNTKAFRRHQKSQHQNGVHSDVKKKEMKSDVVPESVVVSRQEHNSKNDNNDVDDNHNGHDNDGGSNNNDDDDHDDDDKDDNNNTNAQENSNNGISPKKGYNIETLDD